MNLENKVTDFLPPHQKIRLFFHFIFTFPNGKPLFVLRQDFFYRRKPCTKCCHFKVASIHIIYIIEGSDAFFNNEYFEYDEFIPCTVVIFR